jgi:hypothetical protein
VNAEAWKHFLTSWWPLPSLLLIPSSVFLQISLLNKKRWNWSRERVLEVSVTVSFVFLLISYLGFGIAVQTE